MSTGLLTCDPNLVPDARPVRTISFDEAAELAYFGAKVLHPATIGPAKERNIPVRILNSRRPEAPGTKIIADAIPSTSVLKSLGVQARCDGRKHPFQSNADGAWILAIYLRGVRPVLKLRSI